MFRAAISLILILAACSSFAQNNSDNIAKPELSLTLIPPSPVTDKVELDIRAGIHNHTHSQRTFHLRFFLDEEKKQNTLYESSVSLDQNSSAGVKFPWSTKNKAGQHTIILVCQSGKDVIRKQRKLQILASDIRSTRKIDGAFMGFYHWSETEGRLWNTDIKRMTENQWCELVNAQHELEMNIIVMQEVFRNQMYVDLHKIQEEGYKGLAYYPSGLYPGRMPIKANDPVEAVLSQADTNNMNVFVAVGLYAWFDFSKGSLEWHKKVADELWERYGHHPSFYGWYISEEMDGGLGNEQHRKDMIDFFRGFSAHVHRFAPDKPVMLATNSYNIRDAEGTYAKLLPYLDILCPFGFHHMPKEDFTGEEAAEHLQRLCNTASMHLWMDMEVFNFAPDNALVPRPIEGLLSDLNRFPNFEKIICYQFPGLMNSPEMSIRPGGEKTVQLFREYKKYVKNLGAPEK
jgi:hypothetical protein